MTQARVKAMISSIFNKIPSPLRRSFRDGAFTLIELLTVIVIIAILVALLFPAIKSIILKTEVNQARADTKAIENAISSYKNEYGKLPTQTADQGGSDKVYSNVTNAADIYYTLRAIASGWNASDTLNPRRIVFLETPARKGAFDGVGNFLDPWGRTYLLVFDNNYDSRITGLTGVNTKYNGQAGSALVISYGPDGIATNADDITNFQ